MAIHRLELLANALDSFNEALSKYRDGERGDIRAYKFAILNFAHFLELLFKYYVTQSHPLLIYRNPFSSNLAKQQTIGIWEAVQFLRNEGRRIDTQFAKDMEWLKCLRNNIEHYEFTMNIEDVRLTIGRLTKALLEFNDYFVDFDIREHIDQGNLEIFEGLSDEYKAKVAAAIERARELAADGEVEVCNYCGIEAAVLVDGHYICQFCKENDPLVECCVCGIDVRIGSAIVWNDDHPPDIAYICEGCNNHIASI